MNAPKLKEVEAFFFTAMLKGWVSQGEKGSFSDMPGYEIGVDYMDNGFRLLDIYCTTSLSVRSAGTTTIWYQDVPVWFMSYGGEYAKESIPFLKQALFATYSKREFVGGRGSDRILSSNDTMIYMNQPVSYHFSQFRGHEKIVRITDGVTLGWHDYQGLSLF